MELWIRTQKRDNLIKVDWLKMEETPEGLGYKEYYICYENRRLLGIYRTKERALEILDEIQNLLQPKIIYTQKEPIETFELGVYKLKQDVDMKFQEINRIVYEMPKE